MNEAIVWLSMHRLKNYKQYTRKISTYFNKENRPYAPPGEYSESSAPPVSVAILNAVKQELDKHETELKTQSTFAYLRDAIVGENSN